MKHPLVKAADDLRKQLRNLTFPDPVACTYNPLEYAWDRHCDYLKKFGSGQRYCPSFAGGKAWRLGDGLWCGFGN